MNWATYHIEKLRQGKIVQFRPRGNSMKGKIESGQLVIVIPVNRELRVGDIVLCKVRGRHYLHLIKAIKNDKYLIGNNKGFLNGWTNKRSIYGICNPQ